MVPHSQTETLVDFITGRTVPNIGAEENRQAVERFLVEEKGFFPTDITVDLPIEVDIAGEIYRSKIDLVVRIAGKILMCIKCAPGSLGSREREIVAAARLLTPFPSPYAVVSDGKTALVIETLSGKRIAQGLDAFPSKDDATRRLSDMNPEAFPEEKRYREGLIFRSYDSMNVNRIMSGEAQSR